LTQLEGTIKSNESDLVGLISSWVAASRGVNLDLGSRVSVAINQALDIRRDIARGGTFRFDVSHSAKDPDLLHALCRLLMDDCVESPRTTLDQAGPVAELISASQWPQDDLEEREGLLCSLAFAAWRAARILDLSRDVHHWESEYRRFFQGSLSWEVAETTLEAARLSREAVTEMLTSEPEAIFQALLYLKDHGEADPENVAASATWFYGSIETGLLKVPPDLHSFFLGEAARLVGNALRLVGKPADVERWTRLAEVHFRSDCNPNPALARVTLLRMALSYDQNRWNFIEKAGPELDLFFAELGMEEDRTKARIAWAASLKLTGRLEEALEILEPLRHARERIRPGLYGWVLLHSGDIHQLRGNYRLALEELIEAASLLGEGRQLTGLADVNSMISTIFRSHGLLDEALQLLKSSCEEHARLGMKSLEANNRILIAETYLAMCRPKEAELEIRATLPTLQEHAMVAETVVALNLLAEAIRRQQLEPKTPAELRGHPRQTN